MTDQHAAAWDESGETLNPLPALTEDEYVAEVLRSAPPSEALAQPFRDGLLLGALGLAGEAGKVAELVKKCCYPAYPLDQTRLLDVLGEVLWYLTWLCHMLDTSLGAVMLGNVTKLRARSPAGFEPEQSQQRAPGSDTILE